ncbi:MAG: hypothetical protein AAF467_05170 [Actinomycetota bacterium]
MPVRPLGWLLVVAALTATACGAVVEPESFTLPTSTTVAAVESGASSVEAPEVSPSSSTTISDEFYPQPPPEYVPELLISTDRAVLSAGPAGVRALTAGFSGLDTSRAVDDLLNGLVIQRRDAVGEVVWLQAGDSEPQTVVGSGATLLDVGFRDGSPIAIVVVGGGVIEQIRLVDQDRNELVTLGEEESVISLSAAGGVQALVTADAECGALRFYAFDSEITFAGLPELACEVPRRPGFGAVALSPDGGAVAYTVVTYRDDGLEVGTELFVQELGADSPFFSRKIGEDGDRITGLSFDGDRVAYLRRSADALTVSILNLLEGAPEQPVELVDVTSVESVAFARLPVTTG